MVKIVKVTRQFGTCISPCRSLSYIIVACMCMYSHPVTYLQGHFLLDLVAMEISVEHHDGVGEYVHRILVGKLLTKVVAVGTLNKEICYNHQFS